MIPEAVRLTGDSSAKVRRLTEGLYDALVGLGCTPYVKTIYVGLEYQGALVAAIYPHHDRVEVALALPEDHPHPSLIDATHLTWKTMPVAAVLRTPDDLSEAEALVLEAFTRVSTGSHDVELPNDRFPRKRGRP